MRKRGKRGGTIYYSEALNRWVGQYTISGKRKSIYGKTSTEVDKKLTKILAEIQLGTYIEKSTDTLYNIIEKHINQKYGDGIVSSGSYARDKNTLVMIEKTCASFINNEVQKIVIEDIEDCKKYIREYSQNTIGKIWRMLKKGFKIAYSRRKIPFNIMEDETLTRPISKKKTKKVEALNSKELAKLNMILDVKERNHKYRNIVKLQLETGMRIGEVLACSILNVNLNDNTILINNTLTIDENKKVILGKHTKTYDIITDVDLGARTINMNKAVKEIVLEQKKNEILNIHGLLFWDYEDNTFVSYNEINSWLSRINDKYKIRKTSISSHVLRHTRITEMRKAGMDMKVIQYLVGHVEGSKITDDIYTSVTPEFIEQELKKIN